VVSEERIATVSCMLAVDIACSGRGGCVLRSTGARRTD